MFRLLTLRDQLQRNLWREIESMFVLVHYVNWLIGNVKIVSKLRRNVICLLLEFIETVENIMVVDFFLTFLSVK